MSILQCGGRACAVVVIMVEVMVVVEVVVTVVMVEGMVIVTVAVVWCDEKYYNDNGSFIKEGWIKTENTEWPKAR